MPKPKPHRSYWKPLTRTIGWVWQGLQPIGQALHSLRDRVSKQIATKPCFVPVLVVTLVLLVVTLSGIVPSHQPFEGTLTVSHLSFTNDRDDGRLFRNVPSLRELSLAGQQQITLSGSFSSQSEPRLNKLSQLDINLPEENSQWLLTASDSQSPSLKVQELVLQPQTRIEQLAYSQYNDPSLETIVRRLSLRVVPSQTKGDRLVLGTGGDDLQVTLSNYQLPSLKQTNPSPELTFTLNSPQLDLPILTPIDLTLELSAADDQVFWGDLAVQEVTFQQLEQASTSFQNTYLISAIQSGTVRLPDQQLTLEKNQFLIINPPGITTLRRLEIVQPEEDNPPAVKISGQDIQVADPVAGLSLEISGETNGIQAGLNHRLPVVRIQSSFLSRYLTKDQLTALISFTSALVLSLLAWLVENIAKNPEESQQPPLSR